jgi:hypothetical protein
MDNESRTPRQEEIRICLGCNEPKPLVNPIECWDCVNQPRQLWAESGECQACNEPKPLVNPIECLDCASRPQPCRYCGKGTVDRENGRNLVGGRCCWDCVVANKAELEQEEARAWADYLCPENQFSLEVGEAYASSPLRELGMSMQEMFETMRYGELAEEFGVKTHTVTPEEMPYFNREQAAARLAHRLGFNMTWFYDDEDAFDDRRYQLDYKDLARDGSVYIDGSRLLALGRMETWLEEKAKEQGLPGLKGGA